MRFPDSMPGRLRVLTVDDDADTANSAAMILHHLGFEALAAYGAEAAMEIASTMLPQVVILDLAMPQVDGYQLARDLRTLPGMLDVLLICVSGYGTEAA